MKKSILVFLLLISTVFLHGQEEYLPMLKENRVWSIMHEKHTLMGDTIIHETSYKKLFFHSFLEDFAPDSLQYIAAIREDSINEKVYFIWQDHEEEVLLYDFSLGVGSFFEVKSPMITLSGTPYFNYNSSHRLLEVLEISETIIGDESRKTLKLSHPDYHSLPEYWIEGIGSTVGLIYAGYVADPEMDGPYPFLLCLHENYNLIYQEDDPWGIYSDTCYAVPLTNIEEISRDFFSISIKPTLFDEVINIESKTPLFEITIFNLKGGQVYQYQSLKPFTQKTIRTSHWEKGFYIVRAKDTHRFVSKKIIKY